MVSQRLIEELKVIIKEEFGVELDAEATKEVANTLVSYFDVLSKVEFQEYAKQ